MPSGAMRFDLTDLRLFLHVIEAGSITQGAERAHMALASASARIRGMEDALGVPLFERGRRGVQTTPAGRALMHHARLVLNQLELMVGDLGTYAKGLRGQVRVLSNTAALAEFLPASLGAFLVAHPTIDIDLEERPSHVIVDAVAQGQAELGIVADTADLGDLEHRVFRPDPLVLVVPRDREDFVDRGRVAFSEVLAEPFVGLAAGNPLQEHILRHAARLGRPLTFRVRLTNLDAVCRLVGDGVGIAVVPEAAARRCRKTMAIRVIPLTDAWAPRRLMLCARNFGELTQHARRLADALTAKV